MSRAGLQDIFVRGMELAKKLKEKAGLPEPEGWKGLQFEWNDLTFEKRINGIHLIWSFKEKDKGKLAQSLDFTIRDQEAFKQIKEIPVLGTDEIAVSGPGLQDVFAGGES